MTGCIIPGHHTPCDKKGKEADRDQMDRDRLVLNITFCSGTVPAFFYEMPEHPDTRYWVEVCITANGLCRNGTIIHSFDTGTPGQLVCIPGTRGQADIGIMEFMAFECPGTQRAAGGTLAFHVADYATRRHPRFPIKNTRHFI